MIHLKGWNGGNFSGSMTISAQNTGAFKMLSCSVHAAQRGGSTAMSTLTGVIASYRTVARIPAGIRALLGIPINAVTMSQIARGAGNTQS